MTREKNNFMGMKSDVTNLWARDKLFLESEFQHKGNKQTKNVNSQQNLVFFLAETESANKII